MRGKLLAALLACSLGAGIAVAAAQGRATQHATGGVNVRVLGRFLMAGEITQALNVRGEKRGEHVLRNWRIRPFGCSESDCRRLVMVRNRGGSRFTKLGLHRVGASRYRGAGSFWVQLKCNGHVASRGALARYTITLSVTRWTLIGSVRYATQLHATYTNPSRADRTRCPLGPSHDAAAYVGTVTGGLPAAPPTTTTPGPPAAVPTVPTTSTSPAPVTTSTVTTPTPVTTTDTTSTVAPTPAPVPTTTTATSPTLPPAL